MQCHSPKKHSEKDHRGHKPRSLTTPLFMPCLHPLLQARVQPYGALVDFGADKWGWVAAGQLAVSCSGLWCRMPFCGVFGLT